MEDVVVKKTNKQKRNMKTNTTVPKMAEYEVVVKITNTVKTAKSGNGIFASFSCAMKSSADAII